MPITPGGGSEYNLAVKLESEGVEGFTNSIGNAQTKLQKFRGAIGLAGGAVAAFATGALVKATNEAREFEQAMVEVEKVTDPETAREMSDAIREMAETIPLAQTELAGITADAGRFGIEGSENIEQFTRTVAKMATATDLSTDAAGESLAKLAQLTGVPIENVENLGSAVNGLSNNFATSSQEIVDSMLRSSAALSQLGLEADQISALSATLNEVSESSQRAGSRLRRLSQEMMEPKKVADLAGALGMTQAEFKQLRKDEPDKLIRRMAQAFAEGGQQADQLRSALGTESRQAVAGLAQNMDGLRQSTELAGTQMREATSLQREFDAATDTFNARLQTMKNRLTNNAITVGNELLPALSGVVESTNSYLDSSDTLLNSLSSQEKAWGLVALAIAGAGAAGWAFIGGPMTALIGASAVLAAAWIDDWAGIRSGTIGALDDISKTYSETVGEMMADTETGSTSMEDQWNQFTLAVTQGFDIIGNGLLTMADGFMTAFAVAGRAVKGFLTVLDTYAQAIEKIRKGESIDATAMADRITGTFSEARTDVEGQLSGFRQRTEGRGADLATRTRQRRKFGEVVRPPGGGEGDAAETSKDAADKQAAAATEFQSAVEQYREATVKGQQAQAAATAGGATGARRSEGRTLATHQGETIRGFSPAIKQALQEGVEGYRSENIEEGATPISRKLFDAVASQEGGATPETLGVSKEKFRALMQQFGSGVGAAASNQQITQPAPGGGTVTTAGAGGGSSLAPLVQDFGSSVSEFKTAVQEFVAATPVEVLVDVDAGELERAFRAVAQAEAEGVQEQQSRASDRLAMRGQ